MPENVALKPNVNTGVLVKPPAPTDWVAGQETGIAYEEVNPSGDWEPSLPSDEKQKNFITDFLACVTFSYLNGIETQIDRLMQLGKLPELASLKALGFIDENGHFNASDRYLAKLDGTTKNGNYMTAPAEAIRKYGLVAEKEWPMTALMSWDQYYAEVPAALIEKGKKILDIFNFNYENIWYNPNQSAPIELLKYHLKQAPLRIATAVCQPWNTDKPIQGCGPGAAHATLIYKIDDQNQVHILDHYPPYRKILAPGYFIPYVYKDVVTLKTPVPPPPPVKHTFTRDMAVGERSGDVLALQAALKKFGCFSLAPTGYYGLNTQKAVLLFQIKNKVAPAEELAALFGESVGPKTRAKLNQLLS